MFYIHQSSSISPQQTYYDVDINKLHEAADRKLLAIEPGYDGIPPGILRRMAKAVRMGVGAAMPLLQNNPMPDGIIIATVNGGKEDCVKFMNQIVDYKEGLLTPVNFVQSTPNAIAAQIGLLTKNHGYNITHSQLGLAFEYAMIDADMMINENAFSSYLLGAVDAISFFNYNFEEKNGCHKKEIVPGQSLYGTNSDGYIAGEAACMFLVSGNETNAIAIVYAVDVFYHEDVSGVNERLQMFIKKYLPDGEKINLFLTGENGDKRILKYFSSCESSMEDDVIIARFKHMSGEYPTATSMALWLCCHILQKQHIPDHMVKKAGAVKGGYKNVLIYNNYDGVQHSFTLVSTRH